ncbi:MAG: Rne/Rng family ribonuclease [Thermaerobacter sp.]|nr:Rne/Rng family ribonuclease [Thermaerobacter sp.]
MAPDDGQAAAAQEAVPGSLVAPTSQDRPPARTAAKTFKELLVSFSPRFSRLAVIEDGQLVEFFIDHEDEEHAAGNIYKGRVENVLPGMRAAFVNIGLEKNAFLYVDDAILEASDKAHPRAIQDVLKVGQDIVVQVVKEPIGTKGARVTTHLSLPGRYLVLTPYSEILGISRRVTDEKERDRLRQIAEKIRIRGMGLIVRTVAEGQTARTLQRDLSYLRRLLMRVNKKAKSVKGPALLHHEVSLVARTIRDHMDESVDRLVIDDAAAFEKAREMAASLSPKLKDRIELWSDAVPLLRARGVEAELDRSLKRRVWLRCGGYLVMDETEALTVIDVNTGKNVGTTDLADTVMVTNREAAVEIARQLRLRDISGIVVVDFIDMETEADQTELVRVFQQALKADRTRVAVLGLTRLGLMEVTRKKVHESLLSQMTRVCPTCDGRARILSEEVIAARLREQIADRLRESAAEAILAEAAPPVAAHLIGPGGNNLKDLERATGRAVFVRGAADCGPEELRIKMLGSRQQVERAALPVHDGERIKVLVEERHANNPKDGIARIEGYVIDVEGAGALVGERVMVEVQRSLRTFATARLVPAKVPAKRMAETGASPMAETAFRT